MENKFILSEGEKIRILNLHQSATKKQYLKEQTSAPVDNSPKDPASNVFPGCIYNDPRTVNNSGERTNGSYYAIKGNGQFDGMYFYNNYRYKDKDGTMKSYSCGADNMIQLTPNGSNKESTVKPAEQTKLQTTVNSFDDLAKGQYLHFGSRGNGVKELQLKLGINPPTTYFGTTTKNTVEKFQRDNNLTVDGIVGPETYRKIKYGSDKGTTQTTTKQPETPEAPKTLPVGNSSSAPTQVNQNTTQNNSVIVKNATLVNERVFAFNNGKQYNYLVIMDTQDNVQVPSSNTNETYEQSKERMKRFCENRPTSGFGEGVSPDQSMAKNIAMMNARSEIAKKQTNK